MFYFYRRLSGETVSWRINLMEWIVLCHKYTQHRRAKTVGKRHFNYVQRRLIYKKVTAIRVPTWPLILPSVPTYLRWWTFETFGKMNRL